MKQELQLITLVIILILGLVAMTLVTGGSLASSARPQPETTNDQVAWITPDGMLYIQVERGTELLYFDSFNIAALYRVAQSPRLQWQDRWGFRRE